MTTTVTTETTATGHLEPDEAHQMWQERIDSYHHGFNSAFHNPHVPFRGDAFRAWTDHHQVISWCSDRVHHWKTRRQIRSNQTSGAFLIACSSGLINVEQNGRQHVLRPGDACIITMARPIVFDQPQRVSALALSLGPVVSEAGKDGPATPLPVSLRTGVGQVARAMALSLAEQAPALTPDEFDAVTERTSELVAMALRGDREARPGGRLADIAASAQRYVRLHAGDPDLRGETLAAALGWSLRQLQLALQTAGTTPRQLIKETRLAQARELLTDPRAASIPVSEVARRTGFTSASTFSVAFRERYGRPPRMLRGRV
ncbi:AraC family transcriptional regulator [Nocardiopsis coralliicola]